MTDADRPSVFLYRGLMATSHRSVHPHAPVRGKYTHASHAPRSARPTDRGPRGRARAATDRPDPTRPVPAVERAADDDDDDPTSRLHSSDAREATRRARA